MHSAKAECPSGLVIPSPCLTGSGRIEHRSRRSIGNGRRLAMTPHLGLVLAAAVGAIQVEAQAQVGTDIGRAPTLTIERYPENWTHLADPAKRTGRWTEQVKYIPLSTDGSTYFTTGLEFRSRYEGYANVNWGAAPDDGYVWHRFMPYVDFHAGKLRLFAQPMLSGISGVRRAERPVDTTGADMLQAFVEVEADIAAHTSLRMSAGRKLISLGAGRFVDTRYGPNIPQAFDGFDMSLTGKAWQVTALNFSSGRQQAGRFRRSDIDPEGTLGRLCDAMAGRRSDQRLRHLLSRSARSQRGLRPGRRERAGPHLRHPHIRRHRLIILEPRGRHSARNLREPPQGGLGDRWRDRPSLSASAAAARPQARR